LGELVKLSNVFSSSNERRDAIRGWGVKIEFQSHTNEHEIISITNTPLLLQVGKKRYFYVSIA
jgi:tyrosyl-tRNA synthetase